jgi:hypothetical protein
VKRDRSLDAVRDAVRAEQRHSGKARWHWEVNVKRRFGILLASTALGAALFASGQALAASPTSFVGGGLHGGGGGGFGGAGWNRGWNGGGWNRGWRGAWNQGWHGGWNWDGAAGTGIAGDGAAAGGQGTLDLDLASD